MLPWWDSKGKCTLSFSPDSLVTPQPCGYGLTFALSHFICKMGPLLPALLVNVKARDSSAVKSAK